MYYIIRPWKYGEFLIGMRIDQKSFTRYDTREAAEEARQRWQRGGVFYAIHQVNVIRGKHLITDSFHF